MISSEKVSRPEDLSSLPASSAKSAVEVHHRRNSLRPHVWRHSPGSPDPGYKRTPVIRVDSCLSVVAHFA